MCRCLGSRRVPLADVRPHLLQQMRPGWLSRSPCEEKETTIMSVGPNFRSRPPSSGPPPPESSGAWVALALAAAVGLGTYRITGDLAGALQVFIAAAAALTPDR